MEIAQDRVPGARCAQWMDTISMAALAPALGFAFCVSRALKQDITGRAAMGPVQVHVYHVSHVHLDITCKAVVEPVLERVCHAVRVLGVDTTPLAAQEPALERAFHASHALKMDSTDKIAVETAQELVLSVLYALQMDISGTHVVV